jgi:hypothetical protein
MGRSGLKAARTLLAVRRQAKRHASRTLLIAIFSTLVTLGLVAIYLMQETAEFP